MKSMLRKAGIIAIACALALSAFGLLGACSLGKSAEDVIRDGLTEEFGMLKDTTSEEFVDVSKQAQDMMEEQGLTIDNFMALWLEGYDFKIGEIKVDGNSATAEVTITAKQFGPILDDVVNSIINGDQEFDSQKAVTDAMSTMIEEKMQAAEPVSTTVTVNCTKTGDTWKVSSDVENDIIMPALFGESEFV